jgi:hypothetical protein
MGQNKMEPKMMLLHFYMKMTYGKPGGGGGTTTTETPTPRAENISSWNSEYIGTVHKHNTYIIEKLRISAEIEKQLAAASKNPNKSCSTHHIRR